MLPTIRFDSIYKRFYWISQYHQMCILCYYNMRLLGQVQCDKYQINTKVIPVQLYRLLENIKRSYRWHWPPVGFPKFG
jgi:hypothetical protein